MRCLICGDSDVSWITTEMQNEEEGYESYTCNVCHGISRYRINTKNREYTGQTDVFPFEIE